MSGKTSVSDSDLMNIYISAVQNLTIEAIQTKRRTGAFYPAVQELKDVPAYLVRLSPEDDKELDEIIKMIDSIDKTAETTYVRGPDFVNEEWSKARIRESEAKRLFHAIIIRIQKFLTSRGYWQVRIGSFYDPSGGKRSGSQYEQR